MQVLIPINIENFHWYLAVVNAKKSEVHVLDSLWDQKKQIVEIFILQ
jgi:Ulp1 family protease